jgi:UDP-N-acetylmuramate--alanine ligase
VIGGFSSSLDNVNGHAGTGKFFIAEGDESDGSFLRASPKGAIITNVDFDHLDYWETEGALLTAYQQFIVGVRESDLLFYRHEDRFLSQWRVKGVSFGESDKAALQVKNIRDRMFDVEFQGRKYRNIGLSLLGRHNIFNAAGCLGMAIALGVSEEVIRERLVSFKGVKRRLEWKGNLNGAAVYDDYAHHPEEIEATLAALKSAFGKRRIVAVFQPHRYTRFRDFMEAFTKAWKDADELIVTDIYGAGEVAIEGLMIERFLKQVKACYSRRDELVEFVKSKVLPGDVVVTLGAGDITKVSGELVV